MSILKIRPARPSEENTEVLSDLDALILKPIGFKFQGKIHQVNPISTAVFLKVTNAFSQIEKLKNPNVSKEEIIGTYVDIFGSVCDTIGEKEVEAMTVAQCGALLKLILDQIAGQAHTEKKKNLETN